MDVNCILMSSLISCEKSVLALLVTLVGGCIALIPLFVQKTFHECRSNDYNINDSVNALISLSISLTRLA